MAGNAASDTMTPAPAGDAATGGPTTNGGEPLVRVDDLTVDYRNDDQWVSVVKDVSFSIGRGETLGLAGESGCGKTTTALAMFGYHKPGSRVAGGRSPSTAGTCSACPTARCSPYGAPASRWCPRIRPARSRRR